MLLLPMRMRPMQLVTLTVETCVACHWAAFRSSKLGFPFANKAWDMEPTLLISTEWMSTQAARQPEVLTHQSCTAD